MAKAPAKTATKEDIEKNKVNAILCYLGILIIVPFMNEEAKKSPFVKFHLNQGLVFLVGAVVIWFVSIIPIIGWLIAIGWTVLWLMAIVSAGSGQMKRSPIVGNIELIK